MRGRSYSPSPPRPRTRRYSSRDPSTSLLVRNLRHDCRPEDLRPPFAHFGPLKDIYLPRDYYTRAPRGFGFVQYVDPADAADAKHQMDGDVFQGRELTVVFAEENRKKPTDMRSRERTSSHRGQYDRRRSPARYSRSRSPTKRGRSRPRSSSPSPKQRHHSRSVTPKGRKQSRERSYSKESRERSYSRSPPPRNSRSRSRSRSKNRSRSPFPEGGSKEQKRERAPTPSEDVL